jgi:hypothetical protein
VKKLEDIKEKIVELMYQRLRPINREEILVNVTDEALNITLKSNVLDNQYLQQALRLALDDIEELFPQYGKISFIIEREKPKEVKERILNP